MKLDEFVKQTLLDITNGVSDAQIAAKLFFAPGYVGDQDITSAQMVKFEVTVTVNKEAGGGISILSFGDLKAGGSMEQTNRISFEVPVYFHAPTDRNELHFSKKEKKS